LINFAEKVSLTPFPFAAGISGTMKQMQKRIINISFYKKPSVWKKVKGFGIFTLIAVMLLGFSPILSTYAEEPNYYEWIISPEKIDLIDLSSYFNGYEGSFVLYDLKNDAWLIYDIDYATLRTSPNSTYKIYDALFGLEEGIIVPGGSFMTWNGTDYPFETWNADQDLYSAMQFSVNWYFQNIDEQLGTSALRNYVKKIGYGNENINSDLSSYWMQSTLKISPIEQVELLTDLYNNDFGFILENVKAVKDSICLFSSENESFYGKTGTGRINDNDINGWFIGYIETADSTYFFATNIQSTENATGSKASEISLSVLSNMGIWKQKI
ncbi:MAG: BlaR1 family beta-lactam sensor/signal transducer, partial [Lachnospiraceae bacterium]|nr:BlaR1 family beta-lactam sensor/signal transducer [Lachnospiraceae bacterium]